MGYDLHITRKNDWSDEEGPVIGAEEWLRVIEQDPELRLDDENAPYHVRWCGLDDDGYQWLNWSDGEVFTKNPSRQFIQKMIQIAERLGAQVIGDDGELYDAASLSEIEADELHRASRFGRARSYFHEVSPKILIGWLIAVGIVWLFSIKVPVVIAGLFLFLIVFLFLFFLW